MKIACVSISRSDWNALGMVALALREQGADVDVHTLTGHEAPEMITADGFPPLREPPRDPAVIVLCGDRYATAIAAVQAARAGTPIAHLAGGDITEGSTDDSYRHAITKLAHLHFPTHTEAARRLLQMGEEAWRVVCFGSASLDRIRATPRLSRQETRNNIVMGELDRAIIVCNWQPDAIRPLDGAAAVIAALDRFPDHDIVAVGPNDDPGGEIVDRQLCEWEERNPRVRYVAHLLPRTYLSLLHCAQIMVGNSSSAFYEAPVLGCQCIDVGDRQRGRTAPGNLTWAPSDADAIETAIRNSLSTPSQDTYATPFGSGNAAPAIAKTILLQAADRQRLLRKRFVDHEL